jgi:uncharacterized protein (DUF427 family)
MTARDVKIPGPDHPISITPDTKRVRVIWRGKVVADSVRALALAETTYKVVHYIPRADVDMSLLRKTAHSTTCPYKGDASYYSLVADGALVENVVWSYEAPYPAVAAIREYLAFYPQKVDRIEEV